MYKWPYQLNFTGKKNKTTSDKSNALIRILLSRLIKTQEISIRYSTGWKTNLDKSFYRNILCKKDLLQLFNITN